MDNKKRLFQTALKCREFAYAPYSQFKVGAAVLSNEGHFYGGCNVENASYPCGTCAEAGAIAAMVAGGDTRIKEILIVADTQCIIPCGNCMQKIMEFGSDQTVIHCADLQGIRKTFTLNELMPERFKAEDIHAE